jgi:outer membrane immunogenic protein
MQSYSLTTAALAGVAALALAVPALAQPGPAPASDTVDWTGPYVGLNAGWNGTGTQARPGAATTQQLSGVSAGAGAVTVPAATFPTSQMDYSSSSFAGGGQVGYNKQYGHVVVGVEGDMDSVGSGASQNSRYALPATGLTTGSTVDINRFARPDWTSTIRGRVGWATGPVLFYGTGGLAIADVKQAAFYGYAPTTTAAVATANPGATFGPYANGSQNDSVMTGWTVGGGAEWALNRQISLGAEYRHSDYGHSTYNFGSTGADATSEAARLGVTDDQVLAKVNFRFGPGVF